MTSAGDIGWRNALKMSSQKLGLFLFGAAGEEEEDVEDGLLLLYRLLDPWALPPPQYMRFSLSRSPSENPLRCPMLGLDPCLETIVGCPLVEKALAE